MMERRGAGRRVVNPWAVCHSALAPQRKRLGEKRYREKHERCVLRVKARLGMG